MNPAKWLQTATPTTKLTHSFIWLAWFALASLKMRTISLRSAQIEVDRSDDPHAFPYRAVVPLPMSLDTVIARVSGGFYRTSMGLWDDLNRIYLNCAIFNTCSAEIVQDSKNFVRLTKKMILQDMDNDNDNSNDSNSNSNDSNEAPAFGLKDSLKGRSWQSLACNVPNLLIKGKGVTIREHTRLARNAAIRQNSYTVAAELSYALNIFNDATSLGVVKEAVKGIVDIYSCWDMWYDDGNGRRERDIVLEKGPNNSVVGVDVCEDGQGLYAARGARVAAAVDEDGGLGLGAWGLGLGVGAGAGGGLDMGVELEDLLKGESMASLFNFSTPKLGAELESFNFKAKKGYNKFGLKIPRGIELGDIMIIKRPGNNDWGYEGEDAEIIEFTSPLFVVRFVSDGEEVTLSQYGVFKALEKKNVDLSNNGRAIMEGGKEIDVTVRLKTNGALQESRRELMEVGVTVVWGLQHNLYWSDKEKEAWEKRGRLPLR